MPEESVLDQLTKDFPLNDNPQDLDGITTPPAKGEEELPADLKNRHIRRLEEKIAREREDNIRLATELKTRSEYERFNKDTKDIQVDEALITLYGDDENGRKAAQLHQQLLDRTAARARQEALEEFQRAQATADQEVEVNGQFIDSQLEEIEDTFQVDLSGTTARSKEVRNGFLDFVAKISPKDSSGAIVEYADIPSAWELYQERLERPNSRQREIGNRSMARSSSQVEHKTKDEAGEAWLKAQGII